MSSPVILVAGTWAYDGTDSGRDWWRKGSDFYNEGLKRGLDYVNGDDPFVWDTKLDGVRGSNEVWESAGHALLWYVKLKRPGVPISLVAHSHGGQVIAYAAQYGLVIDTAVTLATPVRKEVPYKKLQEQSKYWVHIQGNVMDYTQIFGELTAGSFRFLQRQTVGIPLGHAARLGDEGKQRRAEIRDRGRRWHAVEAGRHLGMHLAAELRDAGVQAVLLSGT